MYRGLKAIPGYLPYLLLAIGTCGLIGNELFFDISRTGVILLACSSVSGLALLIISCIRCRQYIRE